MKPTASPALGALTEIGAVTHPDKRTFHGILVPTRPRKDNPAIPEPARAAVRRRRRLPPVRRLR
ncbi:MAG: hypothetical protein ACRD21_04825 [Vicinamibacteria bacterium]